MKERPILFSGPLVRAILDGRKTQTRRVVKHRIYPNGFHFDGHDILCHEDFLPPSAMLMDVRRGKTAYRTNNLEGWELECPYGVPGDRLWVKETYRLDAAYDNDRPSAVSAKAAVWWEACGEVGNGVSGRLRPSIHMPRWASRITLRITDVRVERLNDCSPEDAKAEGLEWVSPTYGVGGIAESWQVDPVAAYRALWEHINGPGSWDANPFVWAVSFERVTP